MLPQGQRQILTAAPQQELAEYDILSGEVQSLSHLMFHKMGYL